MRFVKIFFIIFNISFILVFLWKIWWKRQKMICLSQNGYQVLILNRNYFFKIIFPDNQILYIENSRHFLELSMSISQNRLKEHKDNIYSKYFHNFINIQSLLTLNLVQRNRSVLIANSVLVNIYLSILISKILF